MLGVLLYLIGGNFGRSFLQSVAKMNTVQVDQQKLRRMIRRTRKVIRASQEHLKRSIELVEQSRALSRFTIKLPDNYVDQSIR